MVTMDQGAYADRLEARILSEEGKHFNISELGRTTISQIRFGSPIRDFWDIEDPIWSEIRRIREAEAASSDPPPGNFGIHIEDAIIKLESECCPSLVPSFSFINLVSRATGLYSLIHIADWVCRYISVFGFDAQYFYPFCNIVAGQRGCVERAVMAICAILTRMSCGEIEVVGTDLYHVHIPSALRMLYGHLKRWPDITEEHSAFRRLDRTLKLVFSINTRSFLDE